MAAAATRLLPPGTFRRVLVGALLVLAALATTALASSAAAVVSVQGVLTGRQGVALKNGEISLEPEPSGPVQRTHTDAAGLFTFTGIETGRYRLRIRYGTTDGSGMVDITEDQRIDIALDVDP